MARATVALARVLLLGVGVVLFAVIGEAALRLTFRDGGERTLGGPGGKPFNHETTDGLHRGRRDLGAKRPGIPRVMVLGDSITYGLGVRDWRLTWPERVAQALEREGRPHEFAVLAVPGNDMPQHLDIMRGFVGQVRPDVVIYQWYANDVEAISHRPTLEQPWQRWRWHEWLRSSSYLYFVLDHRLAQILSRPHATYERYLRREFLAGTLEWTEFERQFHEFAVLSQTASRRILMLYPQVPFRGPYPLQALHDRMRTLSARHDLEIPPIAWTRSGGELAASTTGPWGQTVRSLDAGTALRVETHDYLFAPGLVDLQVMFAGREATVEFVDVSTGSIAATATAVSEADQNPHEVPVRVTLPGDRLRRLAIRVTISSPCRCEMANLRFRVNYDFEVIDLTDRLNTFNTHASAFDAHPNERAHEVMAEIVHAALVGSS